MKLYIAKFFHDDEYVSSTFHDMETQVELSPFSMKKNVFLCCCLFFSLLGTAQNITILDKETKQPILGVVGSSVYHKEIKANEQGFIDFKSFGDADVLNFEAKGYRPNSYFRAILEREGFVVYLDKLPEELDAIVISATRFPEKRGNIAHRVSIIDKNFIVNQNSQTTADLLANSGDVYIQKSQQGGGSPMIRGFSTNRLLYVVDGVRMNTAIFRGGNIQNVISLDQYSIDGAEVFFGPGSVMYGSDAIGGVMAFSTLTPEFNLYNNGAGNTNGQASVRFSTANNEKTYNVQFSSGWKRWAMLTSITSSDFGDLRMGKNGPDEYLRNIYGARRDTLDVVETNNNPLVQRPTAYSQVNLMQKIRFKASEFTDIKYGFHYSSTSNFSRYDRLIRYRNGAPRSAEWNYGPQLWVMNQLTITNKRITKAFDEIQLRFAHQKFEESRIDRDWNDTERRTRTEEVTAYSANLDLFKKMGKGELTYGAEWVLNNVASTGTDEDISTGNIVVGPARYPQSEWSSYGLYASYRHKFNRKWIGQLGARYNQYSLDAQFDTTFYPFPYTSASLNQGALTGSAGIVYRPNNKWSISASAATGFRSPNVDDLGKVFDSGDGIVIVPNPDLKAELAQNIEIGVARNLNSKLRFEVSAYYTLLNDALVRREFSLNGQDSLLYNGEVSRINAIQNAANATVYGVQGGIQWLISHEWQFTSKLSYQIGEEELDDGTVSPSRHAAPLFGSSHIIFFQQAISFDFYCMYNGEKSFSELPQEEIDKPYIYAVDGDGNPYSPSWYTLNLKINYQPNSTFGFSGGVENITDQRYRTYSSGIVAAGRNVFVSAKLAF